MVFLNAKHMSNEKSFSVIIPGICLIVARILASIRMNIHKGKKSKKKIIGVDECYSKVKNTDKIKIKYEANILKKAIR